MELEGKVALVTGGGRGLGRAIAVAMAEQGARVVVLARSLPQVESTARYIRGEYGVGRAIAIRADVAREADVHEAFEEVRKRWGHVDILVNNAGATAATRPVAQLSLTDWQRVMSVDLNGVFLCSREAMRDMISRRWGRIINISSGAAEIAVRSMAPYSVAKAAVEHFTRILAVEGAPHGVAAIAVRPGVVDTPMQENLRNRTPDEITPELREMFASYQRRGVLLPPEQPARFIAYLCGARALEFNGQVLDADKMDSLLVGR